MLYKFKVFITMFLYAFCISMTGCSNYHFVEKQQVNSGVTEECHFSIVKKPIGNTVNYTIYVYNEEGSVVFQEEVEREPHINLIEGNILEITTSHGTSAELYRYYDISRDVFSEDAFWNRAITIDRKIVYMDIDEKNGGNVLVIRDIFDDRIYHKEIKRDFSALAVPSLILKKVCVQKNGSIEIEYLCGEQQELVREIISL